MNFNIEHLFLAYVILCSEFYVFDKTPTFGQTATRVREKFCREKSNNNSERRRGVWLRGFIIIIVIVIIVILIFTPFETTIVLCRKRNVTVVKFDYVQHSFHN
jgi:hypothetical protein